MRVGYSRQRATSTICHLSSVICHFILKPSFKMTARVAIVEQHIRLENQHDLEGVVRTFGDIARYDDEPWDEHYEGRDGVRRFYDQLMKALPDLQIEVRHQHVAEETILVEVMIRGTHLGGWRGLPATGRRVEFPLCGVYTFDADDRLAGEKIYYDRATVLKQLGVFHEPQSALGQICMVLTHPGTIVRALIRKLLNRSEQRQQSEGPDLPRSG